MLSGLESAHLKLIRAAEHIDEVRSLVWDYLGTEPSGVSRNPDGKPILSFSELPPPSIAIVAGEVLYQIRSALDHLAFDLVQLNTQKIVLPKGWDGRCDFPLKMDIPTYGNPVVPHELPVPYSCFEKNLPGISAGAYTFIESLQPYRGGDGPTQLKWLAKLSNIDKHRHLPIVHPQAHTRQEVTFQDGFTSLSILRTEAGAEIKPAYPPEMMATAVKVQGGVMPYVSFDEAAIGKHAARLPVDYILESCLKIADGIIIPAFEKFINNP
jgi:hypothetical protein